MESKVEEDRDQDEQQATRPYTFPGLGMLEEQYRKMKENAEAYPYVWASYLVVYGGFSLWATYRWRKLRKTEDRVLALQEKLRKIVKEQESSSSATSAQKGPPVSDKPSK